MKNKNIKEKVTRNEGNKEEIPMRQPKVRVQVMIPYHILMEIEKQRRPKEKLNAQITNLIIIGLKAQNKVVK